MENKQLIKYKESFISKIKRFFFNLFKGKKETHVQETSNEIDDDVKKTNFDEEENKFFNDLKVDSCYVDEFMAKKKFLKYIDGNVEALNLLSVDRLKKLEEYYDEIIKENEIKIKKLKANE